VRPPLAAARIAAVLALAGALSTPWILARQEAEPPKDSHVEERIQVLEEPWKVGDVKTYSLIFDHAPFGRQTVRLDRVVEDEGEKLLEFSQMLHLDLRALGQEGSLYNFGTVRYARGKMFRRYQFDEMLRSWTGYTTYEPRDKMRERGVTLERAGSEATLTVREGKADPPPRKLELEGLEGSVLVDLEIVGHWERLFLYDTWAVGDRKTVPMVVPSEPVVYDYHVPVKDFRPITPRIKDVTLEVGPLEPVSVFSVDIQAFRCSLPELGLVLWVTPRGGVIKFDNGRGLVGVLER
jgi:hypothetical protein